MKSVFSQPEARKLAEWLREQFRLEIKNAFVFWRMTPDQAVAWVVKEDATLKDKVDARKLALAVGRNV